MHFAKTRELHRYVYYQASFVYTVLFTGTFLFWVA